MVNGAIILCFQNNIDFSCETVEMHFLIHAESDCVIVIIMKISVKDHFINSQEYCFSLFDHILDREAVITKHIFCRCGRAEFIYSKRVAAVADVFVPAL